MERLPSVMKRKTTKVITGAKVLLTLKFNKATSVLSIVIHKAVNLQVQGCGGRGGLGGREVDLLQVH